ncbi:MAG: 4-(cytidine 5'-diphospho)-2-C-methyl-D-erythritol kinase [Candidatus Peregrinibacteria bacterium]|nr:4-(cytidine 5'-diphospho)-2-C-methyl-D-erythritol kinase [Candidatus Peregrinibacteria bacterium]
MNQIRLSSPAKVNLTLDIADKSTSGYHRMQSIMMPIQLHDTILIRENNNKGIALRTKGLVCPQGCENSAYKAAELFYGAAKIRPAVTITLNKRIPLASGLGGGSSNAATVLVGLNELYGSPLSAKKLLQLAKKIGMDTPFFLNPTLALATHFGEKITPIVRKNSALPRVLLFPQKGKKKSTTFAYSSLDLSLCNKKKESTKRLLNFLKKSPKAWDSGWNALLHNDFEQLYLSTSTNQKTEKTHLTGAGPMRFMIRE